MTCVECAGQHITEGSDATEVTGFEGERPALIVGTDPLPYGHPDFYPTPERPPAWRGDGMGAWPGATGVTSRNAQTGDGIVWRANLVGAGMAQPFVVGEKVFVTADPNLPVCLNVHDGSILRQAAIDHTTVMPPEQAAKARTMVTFFAGKWREYSQSRLDIERWEQAAKKVGVSTKRLWQGVKQTKIMIAKPQYCPPEGRVK